MAAVENLMTPDPLTLDAAMMTRQVVAVPPHAEVREAARLMVERGVHRIVVVDRGRLQGIPTTLDVVRAVADGRLG